MAAQQAIGENTLSGETLARDESRRFSRYWIVSRGLILLWLLLSLWQIGGFPLAEGNDEALGVLMGFRLASAVDDPTAIGSPFVQGMPPFSYLPGVLGAHLLPVNEFTLRLPFALVGAALMPLLLALVSRAFGRRAAAFAGLLLLGTGLFAINRLALGIGVFMTFEVAGALFLLRYLESGHRRWLVFSSLALTAAALTFLDGATLLAAALAIAWWRRHNRKDVGLAALAGPAVLLGFIGLSLIATSIYGDWPGIATDVSRSGVLSHLIGQDTIFGLSPGAFTDTWLVYVGVPVVLIVVVGLVEAVIHNSTARVPVFILLALAGIHALPWLLLEPRLEHPVFSAPLVLAVAAFGWSQLLRQINSVAAQSVVAMAVVSVALAGVVWNQAVFNPQTEFTSELEPLRAYARSLDHGHGLFDEDVTGIRAIAQVLRNESQLGDRVFVRDGVPAATIKFYAARNVEPLDIELFADGSSSLDEAFLVIKGEDETFNAGLSGATNVLANHRVFADGEVLYQLVQFSQSGEPFQTPIWWRSDVATVRLFRENTRYSDYLTPLSRDESDG